jgi:hypothetical protein
LVAGMFLVVLMTSFNFDNSNDNQFIEVDGIRFETLVPQPIIKLPKENEEVTVQLGVRITNLSSTVYRFDLPYFFPDLLHPCGKLMYMDSGRNTSTLFESTDVPIIAPKQSINFFVNGKLSWHKDKERSRIFLSGRAMYGGFWSFNHIQSGKYKIRLTYENYHSEKKMISASLGRTIVKDFWTGKVTTPFLDIDLS